MSKLLIFIIVITGTLLLLNIAGFNPPATGFVYNIVGNNTQTDGGQLVNYSSSDNRISQIEGTSIWLKITAILLLVGSVGIVIGSFFNAPPTDYVVAPIVALLGLALLVDMLWLVAEFWSFGMPYNMMGFLLFVPLIGGFIVSLIEWWRFGG